MHGMSEAERIVAVKGLTLVFAVLAVMSAGCVSSNTVGYIDRIDLPDQYLGKSHRAWLEESRLWIEVDQIPGIWVASVSYRVDDDAVYLKPNRASCCGPGLTLLHVDLPADQLSAGWENRIYWLIRERYYPILNSAFWDESERRPTGRVLLDLES